MASDHVPREVHPHAPVLAAGLAGVEGLPDLSQLPASYPLAVVGDSYRDPQPLGGVLQLHGLCRIRLDLGLDRVHEDVRHGLRQIVPVGQDLYLLTCRDKLDSGIGVVGAHLVDGLGDHWRQRDDRQRGYLAPGCLVERVEPVGQLPVYPRQTVQILVVRVFGISS